MNVLYDTQIFMMQRYGGISRYFCEVAPRIGRFAGVNSRIVAPRHDNAYLSDLPPKVLIGWQSSPALRTFRGGGRLEKAAAAITKRVVDSVFQPDVVHETYYWQPKVSDKGPAHVLTIYDMIHERYASMFRADDPSANAKRIAAESADQIICISESTKRDVIELLGVAPEKLSVTYLSANLKPPPPDDQASSASEAPYILYVGERRGYKNFNRLVAAMQSSLLLRGMQLTCFGGGAFTPDDWQDIDNIGFPRASVSHRQGDDMDLAKAYQGALCFVYPSLYEGFGIPPLEAMACSCPIACSNTSSIPEVVGYAAAYFDPCDTGSISNAIESIVSSDSRRAELIALGAMRALEFSWDRCAAETLAVYRSLSRN